MVIHIVSSSKGGMGKTSFSITMALYYLNKNHKCLLFDANTNNIDFFTIMSEKSYKEVTKANRIRDNIYYYPIERNMNGSFCCLKKQPLRIYNGITEFWKNVENIKKVAEEQGVSVIIIDTNLSLYNLTDDNDITIKESFLEIFRSKNKLSKLNLYIWYIWNLNDFLDIKRETLEHAELSEVVNTLENYTKYEVTDENGTKTINYHFKQHENLIHVINPYLFWEKGGNFFPFIKAFFKKNEQMFNAIIEQSATTLENSDVKINGVRLEDAVKYVSIALKIALKTLSNTENSEELSKLREWNEKNLNMLILKKESENIDFIERNMKGISNKKQKNIYYNEDFEEMAKKTFCKEEIEKKLRFILME